MREGRAGPPAGAKIKIYMKINLTNKVVRSKIEGGVKGQTVGDSSGLNAAT
jgi:hypothetical protein